MTARFPELGHVSNEVGAALIGAAPYNDDSGERLPDRRVPARLR
jgi:hypothetical protein